MRIVTTTHTSLDTLNKQPQPDQIKDNSIEGSFIQSTLGTVQKKKPLPKTPSTKVPNMASVRNSASLTVLSSQPIINNTNNSGFVSVGPCWTTTNHYPAIVANNNNQFIISNNEILDNRNNMNHHQQQEVYLSDSPSAITEFPSQEQQQLNIDNNNEYNNFYTGDNNNSYDNNNNQNLLLAQFHNNDYYAINADPYYSHQYGGYAAYQYQQQQPYYGNNYYNQQSYSNVVDVTNEMNTVSIQQGGGWKTSSSGNIVSKNMVVRSDSLKIESAAPVPFSKGGHLPLETHLEKPFEPSVDEQQQWPTLQKKVSKQEIYTFEAPSSILLMKLDASVRQHSYPTVAPSLLYDNSSSSDTPTTTTSDDLTPLSSVSSSSTHLPMFSEPPRLLSDQKHRHSMPLLSTRHDEEEEEEVDVSFSSVEKYFQQPNNVSPVSSRIPSPWGTSRSATMVRQNISRISTGSIPNMMSVQTVQVPDKVLLAASSEPFNKAEQYFNEDEQKRNSKYSLSIASCSLINIRSNTKLYRRMAIKTRNKETQMTYAKYLLQISKLYQKNNHTAVAVLASKSSSSLPTANKKTTVLESPAETRHRLLSEAGYWIEKLAKAGLPEALYIKGRWHLLGPEAEDCVMHGYEKVQETKAFKCFLTASKAGWTDAHYELAHLWKKRGNYTKAIQCYEKGAKEKHTLSIYKMAKILLRGQLKKQKDIAKGMTFLKQAADMEDPASAEPAFVLGCIHANEFDRIGIQRNVSTAIDDSPGKVNYSLALKYLKKSAQHGYADAIYFMGQVSETGMLGQLCDSWQAYQHYMKAAEINHAGAMLDLSRIYSQGISGLLAAQKDMAFKWCKRSADLGFDQAEYVLGKYYEDGIGVAPDFPLALEYFGKAASKGYQPAAEKLNRPMADGSRRKLKKNIMDKSENYLTVVVSEPKVKQDDDDDEYTPNDHKSYTRNNGQKNSNNVCVIQ